MSAITDIVVLAVCEDGIWGLAGRYAPGRGERAISDAKLMMRAGGVAAARVLRHTLDPNTRRVRRELLFDDVRVGADPPPAPPYATPSGEARATVARPGAARQQPASSVRPRPAVRVPGLSMRTSLAAPEQAALAPRNEASAGLSFGSFLTQLGALFSFRRGERAIAEDTQPAAADASTPLRRGPAPQAASSLRNEPPVGKQLLEFLALCLAEATRIGGVPGAKLDARTRFGLHLLILGAGETCLSAPERERGTLTDCIAGALAALGSDQDSAARLVGSRSGYAQDPKPAAMMRAGSHAMAEFLSGTGDARAILADAFGNWNSVTQDQAARGTEASDVAIMFTDMVSSVETTQALGEEGMMRLLAQHDLIVGAVLKARRGHQVKHTGDGIMAVFPRVADGIAAAADIQRDIAAANEAAVGAPLKVRIGLSAGNPIRKEDDYFGTVVQTAARVCPLAAAGEVALPDAMAALPGCEGFTYSDPILAPLKGFAEPQPVRKLLWNATAS